MGNLSGHAYTFVQPCLHFRPNMDGLFSELGRTELERTKKRSTLSRAGKFPADRSQTLRAAWPLKRTNMSAIGACLFFLRSVFPCVISIKKRKGKFLFQIRPLALRWAVPMCFYRMKSSSRYLGRVHISSSTMSSSLSMWRRMLSK